jgi:hypothetical protein
MGLFGKTLCEARIALYNLKRFAAETGDPVLATVAAPAPDERIAGQPATAILIPLTAVILLRGASKQPAIAGPMMQLIGLAADELLDGPETARTLRLREQIGMDPAQVLDDDPEYAAAGILGIGLPELFDGGALHPDKVFRAQVRVGRSGVPFGAVRGVGNAYQAALGWFPLLEWTAREMPYDEIVRPVGDALRRLVEIYLDDLEQRPPTFAESNVLSLAMLEQLDAAHP